MRRALPRWPHVTAAGGRWAARVSHRLTVSGGGTPASPGPAAAAAPGPSPPSPGRGAQPEPAQVSAQLGGGERREGGRRRVGKGAEPGGVGAGGAAPLAPAALPSAAGPGSSEAASSPQPPRPHSAEGALPTGGAERPRPCGRLSPLSPAREEEGAAGEADWRGRSLSLALELRCFDAARLCWLLTSSLSCGVFFFFFPPCLFFFPSPKLGLPLPGIAVLGSFWALPVRQDHAGPDHRVGVHRRDHRGLQFPDHLQLHHPLAELQKYGHAAGRGKSFPPPRLFCFFPFFLCVCVFEKEHQGRGSTTRPNPRELEALVCM